MKKIKLDSQILHEKANKLRSIEKRIYDCQRRMDNIMNDLCDCYIVNESSIIDQSLNQKELLLLITNKISGIVHVLEESAGLLDDAN